MNIFYVKRFYNNIAQEDIQYHGLMGDMDLVNASGDIFPLDYLYLRPLFCQFEGRYINAKILISNEDLLLNGEGIKDSQWVQKFLVDYESGNRIVKYKNISLYLPPIFYVRHDDNSTTTINSNTLHGKEIYINTGPYGCGERIDRSNPQYTVYFHHIEVLEICDTPEELLVIQAAKEGKTLTLEQAKEIAKDWHFGGVR